MICDCSAARRPARRRMRITDGLLGVGRDQDTLFRAGAPKNGFVGSCLHADIAYVDGVVPGRLQRCG